MNTREDYIFCLECTSYVLEYCSLHGPLPIIPNAMKLINMDGLLAKHTIPSFLRIASSSIPGAGLGVYTSLTLPCGVRFGPYEGTKVNEVKSKYCWQVFDQNKNFFYVDGSDENNSNWMRYVNCSRHFIEQNLIAFQFKGDIYYSTIKTVPTGTELLLYYGSIYANGLYLDLQNYNTPTLKTNSKGCNDNATNNGWNAADATSILYSKNLVDTEYLQENRHDQIKSYFCSGCSYRTHKLFHFKMHLSTHLTFKPYSCGVCSFKTKTFNNLRRHQKRHIKNCYACSKCNYNTDVKETLRLHQLIHLSYEPVTCIVCGFKTKNKKYLHSHIKARH